MVRLSEAFRTSLTAYSPTFWRKADGSFESQVAWFRILLPLEDTVALVAEGPAELRGMPSGTPWVPSFSKQSNARHVPTAPSYRS